MDVNPYLKDKKRDTLKNIPPAQGLQSEVESIQSTFFLTRAFPIFLRPIIICVKFYNHLVI